MARVRPPKWETLTQKRVLSPIQLEPFKKQQQKTLARFVDLAQQGRWSKLHNDHFDWWQFPIDDGSQAQYNVRCEADIAQLLADTQWADGYSESVRLCTRAWGWDLDAACRIQPLEAGMGWTDWDVRLAKIIRSLWLFQHPHFGSVQAFALALKADEKRGESFYYAGHNLDEILRMRLPRTGAPVPDSSPCKPHELNKRRRGPGGASPLRSRESDAPAAEPAAPASEPELRLQPAAPSAAPAESPAPCVVHDEHSARFALEHADGSSSLLEYTLRHALRRAPRVGEAAPDEDAADLVVMDIWHTETPDAHRGMGIAGALTATAFSHARERGWRVQASCSYVSKTFLPKHPELAHLVWADDPDATLTPDSA